MQKIILGTVQMGLDYGINNKNGKLSSNDSFDLLLRAFELGVNILDTAEAYGNAHQIIGDFHKLNPELKFKIITKVPHNTTPEEIELKVRKYIKDLNVDFLEVLMFHSFDSYEKNKHVIEILNNLKKENIIKNIGVSVYTNSQIESLIEDDNIAVIQMPFNLLDNESVRGELMKELKANGKQIHTRSAFLQGLFFQENFESTVSQKLLNELSLIKKIVEYENTNISSLALSYCVMNNCIDNVLIGVDSEVQLIENIKSATYKMSLEAMEKIRGIKVKNLDLLNASLWK